MTTNSSSSFGSTEGENSDFLSALGRLVIECSAFEDELAGLIVLLLDLNGPEDSGSILVSEMSLDQRISVVMSLYRKRIDNYAKCDKLSDLLTRYREKLYRDRNLYVHSYWYLPTFGVSAMVRRDKSRKTGFTRELRPISPDDIRQLADKVENARQELSDISMEYMRIAGLLNNNP